MKKLLFILLFFSPLALLSQNKIVIKSSQVTISSLAPIAANTLVANNSSGIATPTAVPLAIGLKFYPGVGLGIDTANFKDSIYAVNMLQVIGSSMNTIGLGGRASQNTNTSLSNTFTWTIDSAGKLFRVNFGSDAGWDLFTRDSATGFWTRIPKGTVGQGLVMLGSGGIGWGTVSGGGSSLTRQNITSGASGTVTGGNYLVNFNPASVLAAYALTMPASPNDLDVVEVEAGGTITSGNPVVTAFSVVANGGQTLVQAITPTTINAGEYFKWRYRAANTSWYREQ